VVSLQSNVSGGTVFRLLPASARAKVGQIEVRENLCLLTKFQTVFYRKANLYTCF
uniref:Uncharacterized protein n=1 Tax=Anopheles minimus TaxID=112268 RepID=A0A182WPU3_9DIPT